jgi:hypothetical protein
MENTSDKSIDNRIIDLKIEFEWLCKTQLCQEDLSRVYSFTTELEFLVKYLKISEDDFYFKYLHTPVQL